MSSNTPKEDPILGRGGKKVKELVARALEGGIITKGEAGRLSELGLEEVMELLTEAAADAGMGAVATQELLFGK